MVFHDTVITKVLILGEQGADATGNAVSGALFISGGKLTLATTSTTYETITSV